MPCHFARAPAAAPRNHSPPRHRPSSAGLRGVTIVAAAGDGGSHFAFGPFSGGGGGGIGGALDSVICSSMNMAVYPAVSPYVLSVGGTQWEAEDMYGPCSGAVRMHRGRYIHSDGVTLETARVGWPVRCGPGAAYAVRRITPLGKQGAPRDGSRR